MAAPNEHDVICEPSLRYACSPPSQALQHQCSSLHAGMPYLWQVMVPDRGWVSVGESNETIEAAYCVHGQDMLTVETLLELPLPGNRSEPFQAKLEVNFPHLKCQGTIQHPTNIALRFTGFLPIRRLSTPSYVNSSTEGSFFNTTWTWKWKDGHTWKTFEVDSPGPMQSVMEMKYLGQQEMYRFELEENPASETSTVFLVDFRYMWMMNLTNKCKWVLQRRPVFVSMADVQYGIIPPSHPRKPVPYSCTYPENWCPVDAMFDYELVPLNPDAMEYHLIAGEIQRSLPNQKIQDIFRIQNPYLWHKFDSKRKQIRAKDRDPNEKQLFHGTAESKVVEAILRQNFDWRVCGKNATMFGKGAYFAKDAYYSDRYTGPESKSLRWMFMARVIIGRHTLGVRDITRPPPIDANKPYGELYDSCVNDMANPKIYVLFDTDHYYPEYVISYSSDKNPS